MLRLSVVIPAYNEARRIESTLRAVADYLAAEATEGEIVVVDDGSTDQTAAMVRRFAQHQPTVRLLHYPRNRGKGHAVRSGMLEARGQVALFCDADGSTPVAEASKLLQPIESGQADGAIGSRELPGSELLRAQPFYRRLMGWVFRQLVRLVAVRGYRDTQCGFKAFRREAAREIFSRQSVDGFAFDVEVLVIARRLGYRVVEVPVRWRNDPVSHIRPGADSVRMLVDLLRVRARAWRGAYRSDRPGGTE
ncbi:MAG: dolichyl-phosphate beta-glucosyltransferase [Candidatus Brocadiia bacterium]